MNIKKWLVLLVAIILIIGSMGACGSSSEPEESAGAESSESAETEAAEEPENIDTEYLTNVLSQGKAMADGISYDMTVNGAGQTMTMSCFMEGDKIKMIGSVEGIESVTIMDGETMINYDPVSKTGMKFVNESNSMDAEGYVDSDISDDFDQSSMTYLGKEEFDGEECLTVSADSGVESGEVKLWINERIGMVVKMEAKTADGQLMTTELTNIKLGKQPAGTFDVPADVEIVELPGM